MVEIDRFAFFDQGVRADDGVFDAGPFPDDRPAHDDGVMRLGPFFDHDVARDDAVVDLSKDPCPLVYEGILDRGLRADVLGDRVVVFAIDRVAAGDREEVRLGVAR